MQRQQGVPLAQPGVVTAALQLQRLDGELQLADAAASQLDVPLRVALIAQLHVDPILHRADLDRHVRVGTLRKDERLDLGHEAPAQLEVAGDRPRLQERLALHGSAQVR